MGSILNSLFQKFESYIVKKNNWPYILYSENKLMYIHLYKYKGTDVVLNDGIIIKSGDTIGEVHIDNLKVKNVDNEFNNVATLFSKEMSALKSAIMHGEYADMKAIYGVTLLHPIAKRFGFTIISFNLGFKKIFLRAWDNILRVVFRKNKLKTHNKFREPKQCWLSREKILKFKF